MTELEQALKNELCKKWFNTMQRQTNRVDFNNLQPHQNITDEIIKTHPEIFNKPKFPSIDAILRMSEEEQNKLNWHNITISPNTTMEMIIENPNLPWDWRDIPKNPNFTFNIVLKLPHGNWGWYVLSNSKQITINDVLNNPTRPWHWYDLVCRCDFPLETILSSPLFASNLYHITLICKSQKITQQIIDEFPHIKWYWDEISKNPNLTLDLFLNNIDKPWDWHYFYGDNGGFYRFRKYDEFKNVLRKLFPTKLSFLFSHRYSARFTSGSEFMTPTILLNNLNLPWEWGYLSENKSIPFEFIVQNAHLQWSWHRVEKRNDFSFYVAINHRFHIDWKWHHICSRQKIPFEFIETHPDVIPWNIDLMKYLTFEEDQTDFINNSVHKISIASILDYFDGLQTKHRSETFNEDVFQYLDYDIVFADEYLVKMICKY